MVTSLLISFASWESSVIDDVMRVLLVIELSTDLGKSFHKANILMVLISESNSSVEHIWDACVTRLLIHEVRYVPDTKLVKLTYEPVFESFREIVIPSGDDSMSAKLDTSFWNITVNCKFLSNLLRAV